MVGKWAFITVWLLIMLIVFGYTIGDKTERGLFGALLGLLVFLGVYVIYFGVAFLWTRWQPVFPQCDQCKKSENYKTEESIKDGFRYRCGCGSQYLYVKDSSGAVKFSGLLPENEIRSYMKRSRFGRWKLEDEG